MSNLINLDLEQRFPFLKNADQEIKKQLWQPARIAEIPAGASICWEGDTCTQLALVLSGAVRVYKVGESGREITLYRIEENESCILTASCILSQTRFPAFAVAETTVQAVLVPASILREWVQQYEVWRDYVFGLMSQRLATVIATVEEVAFRRVDTRIAEFVANLAEEQQEVKITHQEIAFELGTAREVVSRILKDFEREKLISLSRGSVIIHNKQALLEKAKVP
ncbi:MAG: Crp/Fnr family transcriptional regulator [Anaerolineales bacterium]|nr:Crp/Fnr family transcriptional regulator [Anaerolineales bacterium]